jgi:hypothetical protein
MPDDKLVRVKVVQAFTLNHDNGQKEHFAVGVHEVPPAVADHWYFKAHTDKAPKPQLHAGTPQYAVAMKELVKSRKKALEEAEALLAEAEAEQKEPLDAEAEALERSGVGEDQAEQAAASGIKRRPTTKRT